MNKDISVEFTYKGKQWDINGHFAMDQNRFDKGIFGAWHRAYNKLYDKNGEKK